MSQPQIDDIVWFPTDIPWESGGDRFHCRAGDEGIITDILTNEEYPYCIRILNRDTEDTAFRHYEFVLKRHRTSDTPIRDHVQCPSNPAIV